ncbi:hypothetical protein GCM10020331_072440 [Ectobacillus funiculus]
MKEQAAWKINGFIGLLLLLVILIFAAYFSIVQYNPLYLIFFAAVLAILVLTGLTIVQPNDSVAVIFFFGKYMGTIREDGFFITIPSIRKRVSLRVRNFNSDTLKVNDVDGNPIEIAAVVVFKVTDTAKALFDVEKLSRIRTYPK